MSFWPVVCGITNEGRRYPFVVSVHCGPSKPTSLKSYFQEFVDEFNKLLADGFVMSGHQITVVLESFICDAQALCYLKVIHLSNTFNEFLVFGTYLKINFFISMVYLILFGFLYIRFITLYIYKNERKFMPISVFGKNYISDC
jgi:hypothetical protein